jgi:hypothetical protein
VTDHRLVHDRHESLADVRRLYARVRACTGVLLVVPTPGRGGGGIARDVLRALGKHLDRPHTPREPARLSQLARAWLKAHEITRLIIRNADRLEHETWRELCAMTPDLAQVWLWINPGELTAAHQIAAKRLRLRPATIEELIETVRWEREASDPRLVLAEDSPCPTVADADYPVFAVICQQPGQGVSRANFYLGRDHARWHLDTITRRPDERAVNRLLRAVAHAAPGIDAAIARVRGAQMQLMLSGIHTAIEPGRLRLAISEHDLTRPDNSATRLLSAYTVPELAGAAAACLASGRGPGWLTQLGDHEIHDYRIGEYRVPIRLHALTRALRHTRHTGHAASSATDPVRLLHTLDAITIRTGIRFSRELTASETSRQWTSVSYLN